jgi:hypothetical protein
MAQLVMKNDYNDFSQIQRFTMDKGLEIFLPLVRSAFQIPSGHKVILADFGCAGGKNSLKLVEEIFRLLKESSGSDPLLMHAFLSDLPQNNYNAVFQAYQDSKLINEKDFYLSTSIGSFFEQIFPSNSIHIACSFTSIHWMSPTPLFYEPFPSNPHAAYIALADPVKDREQVKRLADHSKNDFKNFLLTRSQELISGGLLIFCCPGYSDLFVSAEDLIAYTQLLQDQYDGKTVSEEELSLLRGKLPTVYRIMKESSVILQKTREKFNLSLGPGVMKIVPFFPKNKELVYDCLKNTPELGNAFEVLYCDVHHKEDLFFSNYLHGVDSEEVRIRKTYGFFRAWSETSFRQLLNNHEEAVEWFYQELEKDVRANPVKWGNDSNVLYCCLQKK